MSYSGVIVVRRWVSNRDVTRYHRTSKYQLSEMICGNKLGEDLFGGLVDTSK